MVSTHAEPMYQWFLMVMLVVQSYSLLKILLEDGFAPSIAGILGVSISTVRRRMTTFHLPVHEMYSNISEDDLEKAIEDIQLTHPNWGNRLMYGYCHFIGRVKLKLT